jgi:hypothetical protein
MSVVYISRAARPAIQIAQYVRNGKVPAAELQAKIAALVGFNAHYRTKLVFSRSVPVASIPDSVEETRERWRFAWTSGPYASALFIWMQLAPQNNGSETNPYGLIEVKPIENDGTEGAAIGYATVAWGSSDGSDEDFPNNFGGGLVSLVDANNELVGISPSTAYAGIISDGDYGRVYAVTCWEISLPPDTTYGYPATNVAVGSSIYDEDRADPAVMMRNLWHGGGQPLWHWTSETPETAPGSATLAVVINDFANIGYNNSAAVITPSGSTQTSITLEVRIGNVGVGSGVQPIATPTTEELNGWTQSVAWTDAGDYWTATFTLASIPIGEPTTGPTIQQVNPNNTGMLVTVGSTEAAADATDTEVLDQIIE